MKHEFFKKIEEITARDPRYKTDAYEFLMQSLWFAQKKLSRRGHVNAKELLESIREFGLSEYGPLTQTVFQHWGIRCTEDFGEIVFNMIEAGVMSKTDEDSRDDFKDVYDFDKTFNVFK